MFSSTSLIPFLLLLVNRSAGDFLSASNYCPASCTDEVSSSEDWPAYHDLSHLGICDDPMLLDFNLHNPLDDPETHTSIRACSANISSQASNNGQACGLPPHHNTTVYFNSIHSGTTRSINSTGNIQALRISQYRMNHEFSTSCNSTTSFVRVGDSVVGIYAGASVPMQPFAEHVLESLVTEHANNGGSGSMTVESCSTSPGQSSQNMGVVIGDYSNLASIQSAVSAWSNGGCIINNGSTNGTAESWQSFDLPLWSQPTNATNTTNLLGAYHHSARGLRAILPRGDCKTIQVQSGDSCGSLATKCGISGADFTKYNSQSSLCSTLAPGQHVCCSAGTLPNFAPKPHTDGTCASHTVVSGDTCSGLAAANSITVDNIEKWNNNTWQFMGCSDLQIGQLICLSTGSPPMPAPVKNAICGPQVPGTQKPDNMSHPGALASLNPCPLNVCCDIWGQCGNTDEFCTVSKSKSGAPGTAAPGKNGCISHCGTDIVQSSPPAKVFNVGYFEGYDQQRPCLVMDASDIDVKAYTHLHFGFATISNTFDVVIDKNATLEWNSFLKLKGPNLILSFGGWTFSTDPSTYSIFRNAVTASNRQNFANKVAAFVQKTGIAGVDFDWEYPGEPDIPGIPAGSSEDGANYLAFLKVLRATLPSHKTISIAAPASYWYLRGFPIAEMSKVVDYIVYMTYDLHGQWDYSNKFSDPGCPGGNCLRSQVNWTETQTALSMITKAGVPSNKIVVGVTSYGRSFKMSKSGCTGPMCTYTGANSGATPGRCTQTAGYLANAEIYEILEQNKGARTFYDSDSGSDIMVYNDTQWVAFMSNKTKTWRTNKYVGWNFLGTVDWAIDLESFSSLEIALSTPYERPPDCFDGDGYKTVDDVLADSGKIPDFCMNVYLMQALSATMDESLKNYTDIMNDGYQGKFKAYTNLVQWDGYLSWNDNLWSHQNDWWNCFAENDGKNKSVGCGTPTGDKYYYVVKNPDTFCDDISKKFSLDCDWIVQKSSTYRDSTDTSEGCERFGNCRTGGTWYYPDFNQNFPVLDPSQLITHSLSNYSNFADWLSTSATAATVEFFPMSDADAVDGSSTMVFSVQAATQAMQQVADVGEEAEKEKKKEVILAFITAFLLVVPGVGEALDGIDVLAQVARIAKMVDVGGNAAMSLYGAVQDPGSAPLAVAGFLMGGAALRDEFAWGKAASKTRGMSEDLIKSMGDGVASGIGKIRKTCKECSQ